MDNYGEKLVDTLTSICLLSHPSHPPPGTTVSLNLTYLSPATLGQTLELSAEVVRVGGRIAVIECDVSALEKGFEKSKPVAEDADASDITEGEVEEAHGNVCVKGVHVKYLVGRGPRL
ncbi:hypothetical protein HDV00_007990 [Rhizophlyctis rosea]|nr:hypothetical protein HDV00_007990 [Rhizophlyctis rosea]